MKNFDEFKKVIDQLESTRAHKLDGEAFKLENSFKIMVINYGYLLKVSTNIPTYSVAQRDLKEKHMIEATRCFVNFLMSSIAFKDHTRRFINRLYDSVDSALDGRYREKIDSDFADDPLTGLIEALRNIYAHDEIPPVGFETRDVDGSLVTRFVVFVKEIDIKSKWFEKGLAYAELHPEDTYDIQVIAQAYLEKTIFPWLMTTQGDLHKLEFDEYEKLRKKARDLFNE